MHAIALIAATLGAVVALPQGNPSDCTADKRTEVTQQLIDALNAVPVGEASKVLEKLPTTQTCSVAVSLLNGLPIELAGPDVSQALNCAQLNTVTRSLAGTLNATIQDIPENATSIIQGNSSLALLGLKELPVDLNAPTQVVFDQACSIKSIVGSANVPLDVTSLTKDLPTLPLNNILSGIFA